MTLTTHAVIGAAVAGLLPQYPALGLVAAFVSHFGADAIPHWDYDIKSASLDPARGGRIRLDRSLLLDVMRIGTDGALGLVLPVILFAVIAPLWLIVCGAVLGMLPDALQFAYLKFPHEPLVSLYRFHHFIHTNQHLERYPIAGLVSQAVIIVAVQFAAKAAALTARFH